MEIILIRGKENAGKTTTAGMLHDKLAKKATKRYLFDDYNTEIEEFQYDVNGVRMDFKSILVINGKIIVIITAGDEVWRLMINITFIIKFVKETLEMDIDVLITCGRSSNRLGSAYQKLIEHFPKSKLSEIFVSRVEEENMNFEKQAAVNKIIRLIK